MATCGEPGQQLHYLQAAPRQHGEPDQRHRGLRRSLQAALTQQVSTPSSAKTP